MHIVQLEKIKIFPLLLQVRGQLELMNSDLNNRSDLIAIAFYYFDRENIEYPETKTIAFYNWTILPTS